MSVEQLEIRSMSTFNGDWEVVMTNKHGFWFPLLDDNNRVVKFRTYQQAKNWIMSGGKNA